MYHSSEEMKDENNPIKTHLNSSNRVFNPDYVEYDEMKFLEKFNKDKT